MTFKEAMEKAVEASFKECEDFKNVGEEEGGELAYISGHVSGMLLAWGFPPDTSAEFQSVIDWADEQILEFLNVKDVSDAPFILIEPKPRVPN